MDSSPNKLVPASAAACVALSIGLIMLCALFLGVVGGAVWVIGVLQLSPETKALRQSAMQTIGGAWHKKIALHAGSLTLGLARLGLRWAPLDPEPRAILSAVRGAEVGVYDLETPPRDVNPAVTFANTDRAMARLGWLRIVGVGKSPDLVAVYVPDHAISLKRVKCCVMVLHERQLVVLSAQGSLDTLVALAGPRMDFAQLLARRNGLGLSR